MYVFSHQKLYSKLTLACALLLSGQSLSANASHPSSSAVDLTTAIRRALESDPSLQRYDAKIEAAGGQVEQAGYRPNPVIGGEMENILGSGPYRDAESFEVTLGLTQLIETAGKRGKRVRLAESERDVLGAERQWQRAMVEADVRIAFAEALVAQQTVALREDQVALAKQSEEEVSRMVEAARSSEVERSRARLSSAQARFAYGQAQRAWTAAKSQLALHWGGSPELDFQLEGSLQIESEPPALEQLIALLSTSAALDPYEAMSQRGQAALELERARAKPDFELFGGARYTNEDAGDHSFVVGVDVPWPLFDRNAGNIRSAQAELRAVALEREMERRRLLTQLTEAYQMLTAAQAEVTTVEEDLLPLAEQTVAETAESYEQGQSTLLNVLESRTTLFDLRANHLDGLRRYAQALARIDALVQLTR